MWGLTGKAGICTGGLTGRAGICTGGLTGMAGICMGGIVILFPESPSPAYADGVEISAEAVTAKMASAAGNALLYLIEFIVYFPLLKLGSRNNY
jgi:hypothetical protein